MKSFLIIGVGSFGYHLIRYFKEQNCETLVVDKEEGKLESILSFATSAKIADCTNPDVLKNLDIESFDACFVCVDSNFEAALEITCLLKDMGAKNVFSCADHDLQAKLLSRNGADHIIYPEKDLARRIALNESSDSLFDSFELDENFFVFEIAVRSEWQGKTLRELDFRNKYALNVLGVKENGKIAPIGSPDFMFQENMHLLVMGKKEDVEKVIR